MENHSKLIDSLIERATDYGKTSYELVKLKVVDKTSDRISSFIPQIFVLATLCLALLFISLGISVWLGEILGEYYYGFLVVASFYILIAFILFFFLHKWLKRIFYDYFVNHFLK